jgi:hypothetical protein
MDPNFKERESLRVTIDDEPINLPDWLSDTLPAIQTYLECMAMKKERVLWSLAVDGIRVDLADGLEATGAYRRIEAQTIGFKELSRHLVSAGESKIHDLLVQVEEASLLVLINDWRFCRRLWREWEPQFREPLFSLRALRELNGKKIAKLLPSHGMAKMVEELSVISCEAETIFDAHEADEELFDPILFSELLDCTLLPWLRNLDLHFSRLAKSIRKSL